MVIARGGFDDDDNAVTDNYVHGDEILGGACARACGCAGVCAGVRVGRAWPGLAQGRSSYHGRSLGAIHSTNIGN